MKPCYGVILMGATQAPILMEAEADRTSLEAAEELLNRQIKSGWAHSGCVVRLEFVRGNALMLPLMALCQKPEDGEVPF